MKTALTVFGVARDIYGREWEEHRLFFYDDQALGPNPITRYSPIRGMMRIAKRGTDLAMPYVRLVAALGPKGKDIPVRKLYSFVNAYGDSVDVYKVDGYEVHDVGNGHNRQMFIHDRDGGVAGYYYSADHQAVYEALDRACSALVRVEDDLIAAFLAHAAEVINLNTNSNNE